MAVDNQALHCLAHAVRIRQRLDEMPGHPRRSEYERQLAIYTHRWAVVHPDDRAQLTQAAEGLEGFTPELIAAAVAALEG